MRVRLQILAAILLFGSSTATAQIQECSRILEGGLRDNYNLSTSSSYESVLSTLLAMTDEQLSSAKSSRNFGATIPIPMGDAFASLSGSSGSGKQRLNSIRSTYRQSGYSAIDRKDFVWLTQQVVNQAIPTAWIRCIELTVERKPQGVQITVDNDPTGRFGVTLKWVQSSGAEVAPRIRNVTLRGLQRDGESSIVNGATLPNLTERLLALQRTDTTEASIAITFSTGHNDLFIRLPRVTPGTPQAKLSGTWILVGLPPTTRIETCFSNCIGGPTVNVSVGDRPAIPATVLPGMLHVNDIRFVFSEGGRASVHLSGTGVPVSVYGQPNPYSPIGLGERRQESIWFEYMLQGSALRVTRVEVTGGPVSPSGDSALLPFTLLAPDILMIEFGPMPLFFVRPERVRMPQNGS